MNGAELAVILSRHGQRPVTYTYFKDKFALLRAAWTAGDGLRINEAKRSPIAGLLQRPLLKAFAARHDTLTSERLQSTVAGQTAEFTLERNLGRYGQADDYFSMQTSRAGFNLVFRLDLPHAHIAKAQRMGLGKGLDFLEKRNHMPFENGHNLAWIRMDIDLETGEALIEEVQNDWLRRAKGIMTYHDSIGKEHRDWHRRNWNLAIGHRSYYKEQLQPLEKVWAEMILCAALEFLRDEVGVYAVYMHSLEWGKSVKEIYGTPPHDLYEDLPRRFCFSSTDRVPGFLSRAWTQDMRSCDKRHLRKLGRPRLWKMEF